MLDKEATTCEQCLAMLYLCIVIELMNYILPKLRGYLLPPPQSKRFLLPCDLNTAKVNIDWLESQYQAKYNFN